MNCKRPDYPTTQLEAMLGSLAAAAAAAITEAAGSAKVPTELLAPSYSQSGIRESAIATVCITDQHTCCAASGRA